MSADKAPGPNGFHMLFLPLLSALLELTESDLLDFFFSLFNGSANLDRINYVVTLIPKVNGTNLVKDFRLIGLLNCIFKIFTKVLPNRLAPPLTSLVDES